MSNHIDHIEIANFKSIRHMKIDGCKRINVFIGYPNVGKSAILEAMSALSYLQKDYNDAYGDLCRLRNPNELFYNGNIQEEATISYTDAILLELDYLNEKDIQLEIRENLKAFTSEKADWIWLKKMKFNSSGAVRDVDNRGGGIERIEVKKYIFQKDFNEFKTNGRVLDFPFGKNLVDIVHLNKEVRSEVSNLFKQSGLKLNIDLSNNTIKGFKQLDEELVFTIPFYQMADTLQRLIFHKAAIVSNENTVLLFEEPEAHMFPPYISNFTGDVISDKRGNQFFIATHSPFVLNDLMEDAKEDLSIYAVGLHNGETTINKLTDEQMHEIYQYGIDLFFNLEDYLKDA